MSLRAEQQSKRRRGNEQEKSQVQSSVRCLQQARCYGKDMVGEHLAQTRADKLTRPPFASTQTMCKAVYEFGGDVAARMSAAS